MYLKHEIGKIGEDLASKYLEAAGYTIIERNFMARQGEIDIIAKDKKELVFIEVKTRTSDIYGKPVEAVNTQKQKHLLNTIKYYLYSKHLENEFVRIDVIEVYFNNDTYKINHIKQIIWIVNKNVNERLLSITKMYRRWIGSKRSKKSTNFPKRVDKKCKII